MNNRLVQFLDPDSRIVVVVADCTAAAGELARAHLSGPVASRYLAQALAAAAVLGAETSLEEETVSFRLDCPGPLGGFFAEATSAGTLRGYTKKKVLDDFDGLGVPSDRAVLGDSATVETIRSVPGRVISSGAVAVALPPSGAVAAAFDAFAGKSLQRRVRSAFSSACGDDGVALFARGVSVECRPDGDSERFAALAELFGSGAAEKAISGKMFSARTLLAKLDLPRAELRLEKPLSFACRCSAERAASMVKALAEREGGKLGEGESVDVTCHLCGRTWTVHG